MNLMECGSDQMHSHDECGVGTELVILCK